jgi:Ca-activated chloride channel family protein
VDKQSPLPTDMQSGSLLFRMQEGYVTATLMNTDVTMDINGLVARVSVRQEFRNEGSEWVEGVYVFPLPDKAAVDRMSMCFRYPTKLPWIVCACT